MNSTPEWRILDAGLNRVGEGLRVVEDYVRFVLDDPFLTRQCKELRHELASISDSISAYDRHAARDTEHDVGTTISCASEIVRGDSWDVCAASFKRVEQSLRSLEEYSKLLDSNFAKRFEALRYRLYTLEKAVDVGHSLREQLANVRLCVLVGGCNSAQQFERLILELITAGVGMIQLRDKLLSDRNLLQRARRLRQLTHGTPTLCVINDRADIAAVVHADGVHVGQEDLPVKEVRTIVGTRMLVGVSTHRMEQARSAVLEGANYLGAGPTFPSKTKTFDQFPGVDYLREVAGEIRLPTFAIGGITAENLQSVLSTGVTRVAVGAAVTEASDPGSVVRSLRGILNTAPSPV